MGIETLGEAWNLSWRFVRCLDDGREGMKHKRACGYKKYLDLETIRLHVGKRFSDYQNRREAALSYSSGQDCVLNEGRIASR